jgi:hypothetical protein
LIQRGQSASNDLSIPQSRPTFRWIGAPLHTGAMGVDKFFLRVSCSPARTFADQCDNRVHEIRASSHILDSQFLFASCAQKAPNLHFSIGRISWVPGAEPPIGSVPLMIRHMVGQPGLLATNKLAVWFLGSWRVSRRDSGFRRACWRQISLGRSLC